MSGETVTEIVIGKDDSTGLPITAVFSKVSGIYAVYANRERVMVQFADDADLGKEQRLALAHLAPVRGEINGLVDGWRNSRFSGSRARAKRFDRRTADALVVALQGDQASAGLLLNAVKADILEERTSIGRSEYLIFAAVFALFIFVLLWLLTPNTVGDSTSALGAFIIKNDVWLAAGFGCLGALFSIAIGIRSRQIHTDLRMRDNLVDAVLRVLIGGISAFVLFSLLKSRLFALSVGGTQVSLLPPDKPEVGAAPDLITHLSIVVAFIAGFSERLVGDYLTSAAFTVTAKQPTEAGPGAAASATGAVKAQADELNPRGTSEAPAAAAPLRSGEDADESIDNCLCDVDIKDNEQTIDENLPKASGGVEGSR
jgi:hypothetical protein